MNKVDFFAREQHHKEHAFAIYEKMPEYARGDFITDPRLLKGLTAVFCFRDLKETKRRGLPAIFSEHGVGMFYNVEHPSYAGSLAGRDNVVLRLSPNETHASREREILKCPVEIVGVPKLDKFFGKIKYCRKYQKRKVAFSFHWDCGVTWATRSSYSYYISHLSDLKEKYDVYGHGHPRIIGRLRRYYVAQGIKIKQEFSDVLKDCDVYVADNSSTIYEFAFFDKPVVLLNCPAYDKTREEPGCPRFWKWANIGPQVDNYHQLGEAIEEAIKNFDDVYRPRIQEMKKDVFTFTDGKCSERAVEVILKYLKNNEN